MRDLWYNDAIIDNNTFNILVVLGSVHNEIFYIEI